MAIGPGKYDDLATLVFNCAGTPEGVIVAVVGGAHGSGFSVQATAEVTARLPTILRQIADEIEQPRQQRANTTSVYEAMTMYTANVRRLLAEHLADTQLAHHEIQMVNDAFNRSIRLEVIVNLILADRNNG